MEPETGLEVSDGREPETVSSSTSRSWIVSWWFQASLVFVLALTARLIFIAQAADTDYPAQLSFMQDARYYASWSERIADGELVGKHSFFMGPLYPYSLAAVSAVVDGQPVQVSTADGGGKTYDYSHVFIMQAVLGSLSCLLVMALGRMLLGGLQGLIAGLCAAGYRVFIYYDGLLMPATQGLFVSLLAIVLLLWAARSGASWLWLCAGMAIGLAALSKGPALLLLPGVWLWCFLGFSDLNGRARLKRALLVGAGCLPLVLLATVHNRTADGDTVLITSNAGSNLWIGNGPGASGAHAGVSSEFESSKLDFYAFDKDRPKSEPPASEVSSTLSRDTRKYMSSDPGRALALLWKKFRMFWNKVEIGTTDHFYFYARSASLLRMPTPGFGLLVPLGIVGFLLTLKRWRQFWPLQWLVITQSLTFTSFFVLGRYRFAAVACLIVFALAALDWAMKAARAERWGALVGAAVLLGLSSWFVHAPIAGMGRDRGMANQLYLLAKLEESRGGAAQELYRNALAESWREGDLSLRQQAVSHLRVGDEYARETRFKRALAEYEQALEACGAMSMHFRYRSPLLDDLNGRIKLVQGQQAARRGDG